MKRDKLVTVVEKMNGLNDNCLGSAELRAKSSSFTRKGKLGATTLLRMIINRVYTSLQLAIDAYYEAIDGIAVSKQAFSQARAGLNPEYVRKYVDMSAEVFASDESLTKFRGQHVIAFDGSDVALENSGELVSEFGCSGPKKDAATALLSLAYDPLNQIAFDCQIARYGTSERELAKKHLDRLEQIGLGGSLVLADRGYPSVEFIAELMRRGFSFVIRVKRGWDSIVDNIKTEGWREIEDMGEVYRVRVLKIKLDSGEIETLLTDLDESRLSNKDAKYVYNLRWGIETSYDSLKCKLQLENFSGKTKASVLQDIYATVFLLNLSNAAASISDDEIDANDAGKELKYPRRANRNRAVSKMRNNLLMIMLEPDAKARKDRMDRMIRDISRFPLSVVRDREDAPPRHPPRKKHFHIARKAVVH